VRIARVHGICSQVGKKTRERVTPQGTDPIDLSLTFIQSTPVTTINVGGWTVKAGVDTGGDGAVTLSKELIDSVAGIRLADTVVSTDPHAFDISPGIDGRTNHLGFSWYRTRF
jgi:hypothetical protein